MPIFFFNFQVDYDLTKKSRYYSRTWINFNSGPLDQFDSHSPSVDFFLSLSSLTFTPFLFVIFFLTLFTIIIIVFFFFNFIKSTIQNGFVALKLLLQGSPATLLQSHLTRRRHSTSILPRPPPQVQDPNNSINYNWQLYLFISNRVRTLHTFDDVSHLSYKLFWCISRPISSYLSFLFMHIQTINISYTM